METANLVLIQDMDVVNKIKLLMVQVATLRETIILEAALLMTIQMVNYITELLFFLIIFLTEMGLMEL